MTANELKKKLKRAGCYKIREGRNHEIWINPETKETFPVSRHGKEEIKTGTANNILRAAGLK